MSAFRVGQRVRVVGCNVDGHSAVGKEGVILRPTKTNWDWVVQVPGSYHTPTSLASDEWALASECLAPLTDPLADAFVERIKKIAREPAPMIDAPRELVEYDEQIGKRT